MDPERADYFEYDDPPERDLCLDGRTLSALAGLAVTIGALALTGFLGYLAYFDPPGTRP